MELLSDMRNVESHFSPFRDSVSVGARELHDLLECTIGSEIILDAPDGAPR
jgi:hypothetical protein